jgi:hypothetical protein
VLSSADPIEVGASPRCVEVSGRRISRLEAFDALQQGFWCHFLHQPERR